MLPAQPESNGVASGVGRGVTRVRYIVGTVVLAIAGIAAMLPPAPHFLQRFLIFQLF